MTDYGGINIETPQEVLARLAQARQQAMAKASPEQINNLMIERALDLAMGNPEVDAARQKTSAVQNALQEARATAESQGLNEDDRRLLELTGLRDALIDSDPEQAMKLTQAIQTQQVYALEKRKLSQEISSGDMELASRNKRYVLNPDTLQSEEINVATVEGAQRLLEARQRGEAIATTEGGLINLYNAERARQFDREHQADILRSKTEIEALKKADAATGLGKVTSNTLKDAIIVSRQPMDQLERAASLINDPRFQSIAGKLTNFKAKVSDLLSSGILNEQEARWYEEVTRVRANIANAVGEFRHERFGGALTEPEIKKGREYLPDEEDTPQQFLAKTDELYRMFTIGTRRAENALASNSWRKLMTPGTEYWDEENDRLFSPSLTSQITDPVTSTPPSSGNLTVEGPRGRNRSKPTVTAQDILNRYK